MKRNLLACSIFIWFLFNTSSLIAQSISINNSSFEGSTGAGVAPPGWTVCASTPDIQPGQWCVTTTAYDKNTYVGICEGEYIGQAIPTPLKANTKYNFTIYLAYNKDYASTQAAGTCPDKGIRGNPGSLQFYGGTASCSTTELLWSSATMSSTNWTQFKISFTPSNDYGYIMFKCPNASSNLLIDKMDAVITVELSLLNFTTQLVGNSVKFDWATASERNNSQFVIQQSNNGNQFEDLYTVNGAGNKSTLSNYTYQIPYNGKGQYFRLKSIDFDGNPSFSDIKTIVGTTNSFVLRNQHVSGNEISFSIENPSPSDLSVNLLDITGRTITTDIVSFNSSDLQNYTINTGFLPSGMYILHITNGNGYTFSQKIMK